MKTKPFKIIHLDDHTMINDYIGKLLEQTFPGCECKSFIDGNGALNYLEEGILKNEKPDMLITDFVHPGLDGYELANLVRQREIKYGRQPMQILLLTLVSKKIPIIRKGLKKKIFTHYLPLTISERQLTNFLMSVINR